MSRDSVATKYDPDEIDEIEKGRAWPVRYLVAWLPWLSLLGYFQETHNATKKKRLSYQSYQSGFSQEYHMVDMAQPDKLGQDRERHLEP